MDTRTINDLINQIHALHNVADTIELRSGGYTLQVDSKIEDHGVIKKEVRPYIGAPEAAILDLNLDITGIMIYETESGFPVTLTEETKELFKQAINKLFYEND